MNKVSNLELEEYKNDAFSMKKPYRHQFNIADSGFGLRAPRVWNDRAGEIGRTLSIEDFDVDRIFGAFVTVDARVKNRLELDRLIAEETRKMTNDELLEKLLAVGLPAAPILNVAQVAENPHFRDARRMYADVVQR